MADIPYARWYSDGTVAYTKGSTAIIGTNTFWLSAGVKAGDIFVDPNDKIYEITAVNDSTSITLGKSYAGDTGTGKGYSIIRNFNGTMSPTLAKRVSILLNEFEQRYDLDMKTITGKSAYDLAKDLGYSGTLAQWLESLKAAGEWSAASERLTTLETDNTAAKTSIATLEDKVSIFGHNANKHNGIWGGRNLGTSVTAEQLANIKNGTFKDMYIGDYWVLNGRTYTIMHFNYCPFNGNHIMLMGKIATGAFQFHSTASNTMGVLGSDIYTQTLTEWSPIVNEDFGGHLSKSITDGICSSVNSSGNFGSFVYPAAADKLYIYLPSLFEMNKAHLAIRNNPLEYPPEGTERGGPFAYFRFRSHYPIGGGADSQYWMRDPAGVNNWWMMHNECRPVPWGTTNALKNLVVECMLVGA